MKTMNLQGIHPHSIIDGLPIKIAAWYSHELVKIELHELSLIKKIPFKTRNSLIRLSYRNNIIPGRLFMILCEELTSEEFINAYKYPEDQDYMWMPAFTERLILPVICFYKEVIGLQDKELEEKAAAYVMYLIAYSSGNLGLEGIEQVATDIAKDAIEHICKTEYNRYVEIFKETLTPTKDDTIFPNDKAYQVVYSGRAMIGLISMVLVHHYNNDPVLSAEVITASIDLYNTPYEGKSLAKFIANTLSRFIGTLAKHPNIVAIVKIMHNELLSALLELKHLQEIAKEEIDKSTVRHFIPALEKSLVVIKRYITSAS